MASRKIYYKGENSGYSDQKLSDLDMNDVKLRICTEEYSMPIFLSFLPVRVICSQLSGKV